MPSSLLICDDNRSVSETLEILLEDEFKSITSIKHPNELVSSLNKNPYHVVLLDMNFDVGHNSGNEGFFWLQEVKKHPSSPVIILMTAYANIDLAVRAMKEGAFDFVTKPWENNKLLATLKAASQLSNSHHEVIRLQNKTKELGIQPTQIIRGKSFRMESFFDSLQKVAGTDANVLLTGENGTGKTVFAKELHKMSARSGEVFMTVDLASLSHSVFESELFGHTKGAFTDAREARIGRFQAADGGTLFLDEIGNLSPRMQSKLLSTLQNRQVVPVGSNEAISVNIRLICATNRDILQMIEDNLFREDLYYRINTITLEVPPLRERKEDIRTLTKKFLKEFTIRYHRKKVVISHEMWDELHSYHWPGNIRELEHTIEKAVIMTDGDLLKKNHLILNQNKVAKATPKTLEEIEREAIVQALESNNRHVSNTAQQLGITRQTIYNKMKTYGI